jgi:hypothetical protein
MTRRFGASYAGCGCSAPPSYSGCGTFFGLSRKPENRLCYLEKKLAEHQEKCAKGKERSCTKVAQVQAEMYGITGQVPGQVVATAGDAMYAQQEAALAAQLRAAQQVEGTALRRFLPVAGVGLAGLLVVWAISEVV